MIRLDKDRTKTLLAIHGWSAVALGLLLYAVIVTGTASVFAEEINNWSSPLMRAPTRPFPAGIGRALMTMADTIDPKFYEEMFAVPQAGGRVKAFFHRDEKDANGKPMERGVATEIDPTSLAVIARHEGTDDDIEAKETAGALGDFMVEWHIRLHLPDPWGLLLTGLLGLAMMVAAVSGFIVHRHLLKELFTLRRLKDRLLVARDRHVLAGSWSLPFAFMLAFTGSYFSFASSFGIPAMAMVAFGGDQDRMLDTLVGVPGAEDSRAARMADLDAMLADARGRSRSEPSFLQVKNWGRADALVTIFTEPATGKMFSSTFVYQGASGAFRYEKPGLGLKSSWGSNLSDLMGPLHFGNFAGTASKAVWFALGFAGAYVALTGLSLWTERRREQSGWRWLRFLVTSFGYGLPLALVAVAYGYFPARDGGEHVHTLMMSVFVGVLLASGLLTALLRDPHRTRRVLIGATALLLLGLPILRLLCGGMFWPQALSAGWAVIPALDTAFALAGVVCLTMVARRRMVNDARLSAAARS